MEPVTNEAIFSGFKTNFKTYINGDKPVGSALCGPCLVVKMFVRSVRQLCTATAKSGLIKGAFVPIGTGLLRATAYSPVPSMATDLTPSRIWTDVLKERIPVGETVSQETMELDSVMRKRKKKMKKHKLRKRRKREKAEKRKLSQGR